MEIGQKVIPIRKSIGGHFKESLIFDDLVYCSTCEVCRILNHGVIIIKSLHGYEDMFLETDVERGAEFE